MKLSAILQNAALSAAGSIQMIMNNPKHKSERERKKQVLATWKTVFDDAKLKCNNDYERMIVYAFSNMVTAQTTNTLDTDEFAQLLNGILKLVHNYKDGDFNE